MNFVMRFARDRMTVGIVSNRLAGSLNIRVVRHAGVGFITALLVVPLCSGLLCAQCDSTSTSGTCMTSPPVATHCEGTSGADSKAVNCMISKIKEKSGEVIRFVRGCTAVRVGLGCVEYPSNPNRTLCYETCDTDNCNVAIATSPSIHAVLYAIILSTAGIMYCS